MAKSSKTVKLAEFPLHHAVHQNDFEKVQSLIASGSDINSLGGQYGNVPAFYALENEEIFSFLINHEKFDLKTLSTSNKTILHFLAIKGKLELIKLLSANKDFKSILDQQDHNGNTALHMLALVKKENDHTSQNAKLIDKFYEIYRFLTENGAAEAINNQKGQTALAICPEYNKPGTLPETEKLSEKKDNSHVTIQDGDITITKLFGQADLKITREDYGITLANPEIGDDWVVVSGDASQDNP